MWIDAAWAGPVTLCNGPLPNPPPRVRGRGDKTRGDARGSRTRAGLLAGKTWFSILTRGTLGAVASLVFILFGVTGLVMIIRGWRGSRVSSGPRCAKCRYDLRGSLDLQFIRCSECGSDLTRAKAILRSTRRKNTTPMVAGLIVMLVPWLFLLLGMIIRYIGPNGERLRSNAGLIKLASSDPYPYWEWRELTQRLSSGHLSAGETSVAIDVLTKELEGWNAAGVPLACSGQFFREAVRLRAVTGAQDEKLARTLFAKVRRLNMAPSVVANQSVWIDLSAQVPRQLPVSKVLFAIRSMSLSKPGETEKNADERPWDGLMQPPDLDYLSGSGWGQFHGTVQPRVPSGKYQMTFVVDVGLVSDWGLGGGGFQPGQASRWPSTRAKWTETFTLPLEVFPALQVSRGTPIDKLRVETDSKLDPQTSGCISVASAEELCYTDQTIVSVDLKIEHPPVSCFVIPVLKVAGEEHRRPAQVVLTKTTVYVSLGFTCDSLPKDVHTVDVELRPSLSDMAIFAEYDRFWGKTIYLKNIKLARRDLDFSLGEWQIGQKVRSTTAPASGSSTH
jgi:hypothetical protein